MQFRVIPRSSSPPAEGQDVGYLRIDNWDDMFRYQTLYHLFYFDNAGNRHEIGLVKIGQVGQEHGRPDLPRNFDSLDERFFSLGQDVDYYSSAMELGQEVARKIMSALNDIANNDEIYQRALGEDVTSVSLLRSVNLKTIEWQYRRVLDGGLELSPYKFEYEGPKPSVEGVSPLHLEFQVRPESWPPTNIHVLIGRNGVGKTFLLNAMVRALVSSDTDKDKDGSFTSLDETGEQTHESPFVNILSISFSAFDEFEMPGQDSENEDVRHANVGLRMQQMDEQQNRLVTANRSPGELASQFSSSALLCARGDKTRRWRDALITLETDTIFEEAEVRNLADVKEETFKQTAIRLYERLSSGHKIVLLTITKLVEYVEEKTLVLIDEPEAHLHPPLLAAFVRALSDLLANRNGVAIIATHSPVVLQEVPRSCVWKIDRHGQAAKASRPEIETFAENVGILTKAIFGLEVTHSGFHRMLLEAAKGEIQLGDVLAKFENNVGSEGRALITGMIASQDPAKGE